MTGPWKGGKSKSSFPHLPTAPWKSGPTGQDSHIPVSRLLLRKQKREQKQQTLTDDQSVNHAPGLKCQLSPRLYIHAVPTGLHSPVLESICHPHEIIRHLRGEHRISFTRNVGYRALAVIASLNFLKKAS